MERRTSTLDLEVRAVDGKPDAPMIVGYAAVFGQMSEDLGGFREQIAPGAFTKALGGDVRALFNHDPNIVLGRTKSKTLRLAEDQKGLKIEIDPPNTAQSRSIIEALTRGDISQMSFGFRTIDDKWENIDGKIVRTLLNVELFDVSPVTFPAYPQTEAGLRSLDDSALNAFAEFRKKSEAKPETGPSARMKMLTLQASI